MKRLLAILVVCGLGGAATALNTSTPAGRGPAMDAPATQPTGGKLIVHEWGTFTGFAGSDGVHLPFGTNVGDDLPPFVVSRVTQAQRHNAQFNWIELGKGGGAVAMQRMETPVIYFYTDRPREVTVGVDFPQGLLTEFYPPVRAMAPAIGDGPGEPRVMSPGVMSPGTLDAVFPTTRPAPKAAPKLEGGSLDWGTVRLVPQVPGQRPAYMPEVPETPAAAAHYEHARETDAATVQFSDRPGELHEERFLFYRGLGDFTLPVSLAALGGERFEISNAGAEPIRFAVLVHVADGRARFAAYRDIVGTPLPMALPSESVALDDVGEAIARALVAEGLYEREARAMVKTWRSAWLGEPGTRVLYTVPRPVTDALLPLRLDPVPDELVRVLVGRIDVMTPEQETKVQSLLATSSEVAAMPPADAAYLRGFGRFVDPAIRRAAQLRQSASVERGVSALRSQYHAALRQCQAAEQAEPR